MPVVINRSSGDGSKKPGGSAAKGSAKKPTKSKKAGAAQSMDPEKMKLVALVVVIVLAVGAVGWWFLGRSSEPEAAPVTSTGTGPRAPIVETPGAGRAGPTGPGPGLVGKRGTGAFGSNLGGPGNNGEPAVPQGTEPGAPPPGQAPGFEHSPETGGGAGGPAGHGPE